MRWPLRQLWRRLPSLCAWLPKVEVPFPTGPRRGVHPGSQDAPVSPVFWFVPRCSGGVNYGVSELVSAAKNQGLCGSCSAFSVTHAVELQFVLSSGEFRVILVDFMPTSLLKQYFLALVALFGVFTEVSVPSSIRASTDRAGRSL